MKVVVYQRKGIHKKLFYCDVNKPVPSDNEVLVKIYTVSINAADYRSMRMGLIPKKKIFGADIAGSVESVGKNIRQFKPGDDVFGDLAGFGFGGLAEYTATPERALVIKPARISFEEAAALPVAGLTALQALRDNGNIQNGQQVLIVGSGGGVGTFAVQLARYFGAEVTAVCSTKNVEQTTALGAAHVIDYTKEDFTIGSKRYDIILAVNGNHTLQAYRRILKSNGTCIVIVGALWQIFMSLLFGWLLSIGSKKIRTIAAKPVQKDLEFLAKLVEEGKIKPVIEKRYPLDQTAEAMRYLSAGHAKGKVVITVL